jgi:hypothetical protein
VALPSTPRPPLVSRSGVILLLYSGLGLAGLAWGFHRGHPNILSYPGAPGTRTGSGLVLGAAFALLVVFLSRWSAHRFEWGRTLEREFRHILGPLSSTDILLLAGASSIGEEAFFRGAMTPSLGLWGSSLLFALPHIGPKLSLIPWTISSLGVGLALGGLYMWSGDLAGPVCAHFLINFLNLQRITQRA